MAESGVDISDALEKVRNSGEFVNQEQNQETDKLSQLIDKITEFISELRQRFVDWLEGVFPDVNVGSSGYGDIIINVIAWSLVTVLIIVLIITLFKLLEHYRKTEKEEFRAIINLDSGKLDSGSWMNLAKNHATKAEYREACRAVYMGVIFYLDEKSIIKYDNAKTNMEYLQVVRSKEKLYSPMKRVIEKFEYLWYGKQTGTEDDYKDCLDFYYQVKDE